MSSVSQLDFVAVPIQLELYQELMRRHGTAANAVIEEQVEAFLKRTQDDPIRPRVTEGLTWNNLFLCEKTRIRTKYYSEYRYAEILGDCVVYGGESFPSVSRAVNKMRGGTQNNAWKVVEILRPSDSKWIAAEQLRRK
ncbi:hypothetical protein [Marinobacter apostichopi]|uniref:hypothetical protein n=1 Tax=Marinobacter apostichopi TaxID=3035454 RepID=UPI0025736EF4|nr:hypothetical protein [Marinobacter sp. LA51]